MQFFLSILLAPLNSLPFLQDAFVLFTSIPSTIANGGRCLAGINSIVNHTIVDADGFAHGSCWSDKSNKWGALSIRTATTASAPGCRRSSTSSSTAATTFSSCVATATHSACRRQRGMLAMLKQQPDS